MALYFLKNKKTLLFKNKACDFLKGYTTNGMDAPQNVFTDIHGKIVAACDQKKLSEEEVLMAAEGRYLERLKEHLKKYLPLSDTRLEETAYLAYFDIEGDHKIQADEIVIPQRITVTKPNVGAHGCAPLLILSKNRYPSDISDEDFTRFRVENSIPMQGIDYDSEMILNVGEEGWVSYTKGCYLGQEIVARVHYKGKPPRKLVVRAENECTPEESARMTSKILGDHGTVRGFVFLENN